LVFIDNLDFSQVRVFGVLQRFAMTYALTASVSALIELYGGGHGGEDKVRKGSPLPSYPTDQSVAFLSHSWSVWEDSYRGNVLPISGVGAARNGFLIPEVTFNFNYLAVSHRRLEEVRLRRHQRLATLAGGLRLRPRPHAHRLLAAGG